MKSLLRLAKRSFRLEAAAAAARAAACLLATQVAGVEAAGAATNGSGTGFSLPFSGPARYANLAPTEIANASQLARATMGTPPNLRWRTRASGSSPTRWHGPCTPTSAGS